MYSWYVVIIVLREVSKHIHTPSGQQQWACIESDTIHSFYKLLHIAKDNVISIQIGNKIDLEKDRHVDAAEAEA